MISGCNHLLTESVQRKNVASLEEITNRFNVQTEVVHSEQIIEGNMVPVGSLADGYHVFRDNYNTYNGHPSYLFRMKDDRKNRIEFSSLFTTDNDIKHLSLSERNNHIKAKSLYHYGKGKVSKSRQTWIYTYGLWLPSSLNEESKGIISQWHGIPDRTTIRTPTGKIVEYTLNQFNSEVLSKMYFKSGVGYSIDKKDKNGFTVDQGGYPPLALKVGEGYLYVSVRSDHNRVTNKRDRVNLRPPLTGPKLSKLGTKTISNPYMKRLSELPREQWIDMRWEIIWPSMMESRQNEAIVMDRTANNGSVKLWMNNIKVLDWKGNLGNNDKYGTYFKYGLYKPGASGIEIRLAGFKQQKRLDHNQE
ncbi:hypothetical protein BIT28_06800 [Photobacterium proteolyticum]|uniref:Uncharacterized protein n=2 Tax=Photobacterium proteolyticum TaxID=1903952 RepID=A0A1Q9GEQ5_9GAMM|nr:hypothetical protein BIT28_06800 [Photobacterium proteolyticum]